MQESPKGTPVPSSDACDCEYNAATGRKLHAYWQNWYSAKRKSGVMTETESSEDELAIRNAKDHVADTNNLQPVSPVSSIDLSPLRHEPATLASRGNSDTISKNDPTAEPSSVLEEPVRVPRLESPVEEQPGVRNLRKRSARSINPYSYERTLYMRSLNQNGWEDAVVTMNREQAMRKEERNASKFREDADNACPSPSNSNSLEEDSSNDRDMFLSDNIVQRSNSNKKTGGKPREMSKPRKSKHSHPNTGFNPSPPQSPSSHSFRQYTHHQPRRRSLSDNFTTNLGHSASRHSIDSHERSVSTKYDDHSGKNERTRSIRKEDRSKVPVEKQNNQEHESDASSKSISPNNTNQCTKKRPKQRKPQDRGIYIIEGRNGGSTMTRHFNRRQGNPPRHNASGATEFTSKNRHLQPQVEHSSSSDSESPELPHLPKRSHARNTSGKRAPSSPSDGNVSPPSSPAFIVDDVDIGKRKKRPKFNQSRLDLSRNRKSALQGMMPKAFIKRAEADLRLMKEEFKSGRKDIAQYGSGDDGEDDDDDDESMSLEEQSQNNGLADKPLLPGDSLNRSSEITGNVTSESSSRLSSRRPDAIPWPIFDGLPVDLELPQIPHDINLSCSGYYVLQGHLRDLIHFINAPEKTSVDTPRTIISFGHHLDSAMEVDSLFDILSKICDNLFNSVNALPSSPSTSTSGFSKPSDDDVQAHTAPLRFLAHFVQFRDDLMQSKLVTALPGQLLHLSRRLADASLATEHPSPLLLWIYWWIFEIMIRVQVRCASSANSLGLGPLFYKEIEEVTTLLLGSLQKTSSLQSLEKIFKLASRDEYEIDSPLEVWIGVINVYCSADSLDLPESVWKQLWSTKEVPAGSKYAMLQNCEELVQRCTFLSAISQIYSRGQIGVPRLPCAWEILKPPLGLLSESCSSSVLQMSNSERTARDNYTRIWLRRTLNLCTRWSWWPTFSMLWTWYDVFKSNKLADLYVDPPSEFPPLLKLFRDDESDVEDKESSMHTFMRLVRLVINQLDSSPINERRRQLGRFLLRIVPSRSTLASYMSLSDSYTEATSKATNAYSLHILGVILMPETTSQRIEQLRSLIDIAQASMPLQRTTLKAALQLSIVIQHFGLSYDLVFNWLVEIAETIFKLWEERNRLPQVQQTSVSYITSNPKSSNENSCRDLASVLRLVIKIVRRILEMAPKEFILGLFSIHKAWTSNLLSSSICHTPFLGEEVVELLKDSIATWKKERQTQPQLQQSTDDDVKNEEGPGSESFPFDEEIFQDPALNALVEGRGAAEDEHFIEGIKVNLRILDTLSMEIFHKNTQHPERSLGERASYLANICQCIVECVSVISGQTNNEWIAATREREGLWSEMSPLGRTIFKLYWYINVSNYDPSLLKTPDCIRCLLEAMMLPFDMEQSTLLERMITALPNFRLFECLDENTRAATPHERENCLNVLLVNARIAIRESAVDPEMAKILSDSLKEMPQLLNWHSKGIH